MHNDRRRYEQGCEEVERIETSKCCVVDRISSPQSRYKALADIWKSAE